MILIDYNGVAISSIMLQMKGADDFDESFIRHIILNNIRHARAKFLDKYGEITICCDGPNVWRKTVFPYYKANRKASREAATFDWPGLFKIMNKIRTELKENFPYKTLLIDGLEADDIIAVLAHQTSGPHVIVSNDKDFFQLQKLTDLAIYSPRESKMVKCDSPDRFLVEQIIRGDKSDGVPNILSADDTFIMNKRQGTITSKKLEHWISSVPENVFDEDTLARYKRNEQLISLMNLPEKVKIATMDEYAKPGVTDRSKLLPYFIKSSLRNMIDKITEF